MDEPLDDGTFDHDVLECGAPEACPVLSYHQHQPPNPATWPTKEAYQCALARLRDREPTLLVVSDGCEGRCTGSVYLVRSDGTALRQSWNELDDGVDLGSLSVELSSFTDEGEECTLKTPAFYDGCDHAPEGDCASASQWFDGCTRAATRSCAGG